MFVRKYKINKLFFSIQIIFCMNDFIKILLFKYLLLYKLILIYKKI